MNYENETFPNVNTNSKDGSVDSSVLNNSNIKNAKLNNSSDCNSIISNKEDKDIGKNAFFDKIYNTKHESKSILSIAKNLSGNIKVSVFFIFQQGNENIN